jgi:hypothetical protein
LKEAARLLETLHPRTSNDTETLGLWGAVHKRLHSLESGSRAALDESIRAYERGFFLRNDYYNGINFAFMLNVRAATADDASEAIADFVQARRVRREVREICEALLTAPTGGETEAAIRQNLESRYWVLATLAEALIGMGEEFAGESRVSEALSMEVAGWMKESTRSQIDQLRRLLEKSPLTRISAP